MDTYKDESPGLDNPAFYTDVDDVPPREPPRGSISTECSYSSTIALAKGNLSTKEYLLAYFTSQKGRELCMGTSLMMAVTLIVIGLTLLFSLHLSEVIIGPKDISIFVLLMFSVSTASMLVMVLLGHFNKLTSDDHYKDQRRTTFLRGGMTVLATGGVVYYVVEVSSMVYNYGQCHQSLLVSKVTLAIIFTVLQVVFLLRYSKIRINKSFAVVTACRFMLMIIIATNAVVWLMAVITETLEELEHSIIDHYEHNDTEHDVINSYRIFHEEPSTWMNAMEKKHKCHGTIGHDVSPFLFPLLIEFCVVASTMTLAIWEKCGVGLERLRRGDVEVGKSNNALWEQESGHQSSSASTVDDSVSTDEEEAVKRSGFYNKNMGFVCGWLALIGSIVCILLMFFGLYSKDGARWLAYAINSFLVVFGIITIPLTMHKMSSMRFKDEQIRRQRKGERSLVKKPRLHRKMDQNLLTVTFLALMTYKMMSILVAWCAKDAIILVDAIASIVHGFMQTAFLNWYACHKRAKTRQEFTEKPGRQFLEFLRMLNFSLWLVNTFLLKQAHAKSLHQETYGIEAWVIISNILQPLTILYYFHSMVCIAEVITRSYTNKYVGIPRPKKSNIHMDENTCQPVVSFMSAEDTTIHSALTLQKSTSLPDLSAACHHV